ncbi:hypothetical protein E2C01_061286 [Portunus trituberculatus]|uniref:Uncharacterized protein n=1 Tax=Portunus trituberculatus TaxID=210409 RepID=A0A5B7H3G4_PORTR|nr:hypothetical protein [Portunus trituberculatus]
MICKARTMADSSAIKTGYRIKAARPIKRGENHTKPNACVGFGTISKNGDVIRMDKKMTYACESDSRNNDRQGTESGRRWVRNQHRSIEDWRRRSSVQKPASTRRLGIGDVRNAPVAKPNPA